MDNQDWRARDRKVLWHPFTQHGLWMDEDFPVIVSGEGVYLSDADGNKFLDGVGSLWLNVHGHRRSELDAAVREQLGRIAHSTFLGLSHPPGIELAEKLAALAPPGLSRVFFSDDGSTAMEIALKMAYQYWVQQDPPEPERRYFITLENAYHGDTIGAVSLGGIDLFHQVYRPLLFPTFGVCSPTCRHCERFHDEKDRTAPEHNLPAAMPYMFGHRPPRTDLADGCRQGEGCLRQIEQTIIDHRDEIAGVVIEPLMQGAGGMIIHPGGFLRGLADLCQKHGVLLIADEVATGFGRTGTMFACEAEGVTPDLMAVGKGLSGGYLPIAATLATENIFNAFLSGLHSERTFFHGHSFTANPLACAAALASLKIFEADQTLENVAARAEQATEWMGRMMDLPHVAETRQAGLMIGIELEDDPHNQVPYPPQLMMGRRVCLHARRRGLIIRPLGDVIVLMPPLCVSAAELDMMLKIAYESIQEVTA